MPSKTVVVFDPQSDIHDADSPPQLPTFIYRCVIALRRRWNGDNRDLAVTKAVGRERRDRIEADARSVSLQTANARMWPPRGRL